MASDEARKEFEKWARSTPLGALLDRQDDPCLASGHEYLYFVTRWAFEAYAAGKEAGEQRAEKAERELDETLAAASRPAEQTPPKEAPNGPQPV
jgi:hypothetical protein